MKKEIRDELKWIKNLESTQNHKVEVIKTKGHLKFRWVAVDGSNNLHTCTVVLGSTPSCHRWMKQHRRNVRRVLRDKNIYVK